MVFSFFKKPPEKMVARPAAVPRPKAGVAPEAVPGKAGADVNSAQMPAAPSATVSTANSRPNPPAAAEGLPSLDFVDFEFSESPPDFHVDAELDPVEAEVEEVAVLFANGQDDAVRSVLENAVRVHPFGPGERLWLMLFDFYRIAGQKAAFDALGIDYARSFEKSPPIWREKSTVAPKTKEVVAGTVLFRGNLTDENAAALDAVRQALEKNARLRLDLSKVADVDTGGCGRLLALLQKARRDRKEIELLGRDMLGALLEERVETGTAENKECWLLLLEICQLQGRNDAFEDIAINYAVTFEESPPSWESSRIATPESTEHPAHAEAAGLDLEDVYSLRGDVKASRFADLAGFSATRDPVLIDCGALVRMDFISAGALLNVLTTVRQSGKQIVFRHPNHLVAALFGVVGLKSVATLVFARH